MTLRERFINAVRAGELGKVTDSGIVLTVSEFKAYFRDINEGYAETFLPSAVIEPGQYRATQTRFVFRVSYGVYRVHPGVLSPEASNSQADKCQATAIPWRSAFKV